MNDIVKVDKLSREISAPGGKYNAIVTKAGTDVGFKVMNEVALKEVSDWMPVVNEKAAAFSKQNSQTTASLMTLTMLESGPYRVIRQIMAQVEKKRAAIKEAMYKHAENELRFYEIGDLLLDETDPHKIAKLELERNKLATDAADSTTHIEASLKEIAAYKRRYEEVVKNNNIPETWSEEDFEAAEIEHHIKSMFRNAIRDRLQGSHNMGTLEYFSQFGLNGVVAYACVDGYLANVRQLVNDGMTTGKFPTIDTEYEFLDKMYETFKDEYKRAMRRIGLDSITHADFLMKDNT